MATFVKTYHPYGWPESYLNRCWLVEVSRGDDMMALFWFSPVTDAVVECHACAAPEYRGRWMTRTVINYVYEAFETTGATHAVAQVVSPLVERIWRRIGFTIHGRIATLTKPGE